MRIYLHSFFFFWEANIFTFSFLQFRANMERVFFVLWPSQPICSSDLLHFRNSFSVGHSRYECYYYSYPMKKSWKMGTYCCGWDGVTCDTMTVHVIGVDLSCNGLQGPIHPNTTLFSLRHLQRLNLAYNYLNDSTI